MPPSATPYRAVLMDGEAARDSLIRLWTRNLPVAGDPAAKLQWFYLDGPSGKGEVFILREPEADQAVGCAGLGTRELVYRGQISRVALLADFAIDKAHRRGLPAVVLQRNLKRHVDANYAFSYGFPNSLAVAVLMRTGYHELGKIARFVRVLRHGSFVDRRYGWRRRSPLAAALVDRATFALSKVRGLSHQRRYQLRWETDFDQRWDQLWERAAPAHAIACRRSSVFLRWRFLRKPNERNAIAALVDRTTNALAAYAVVRGGADETAELVDLFGEDTAALDALLGQLAPALYSRGHTSVGVCYLGHPRVIEVLRRHSFSRREATRAVIVAAGANCPIDPITLYDVNSWYLTDLDEDT